MIGMCSFDARSKGQSGNSLERKDVKRCEGSERETEGPRWTRAVEDQSAPIPWRENEQAWKEHVFRSMRAVKGSLGHSSMW